MGKRYLKGCLAIKRFEVFLMPNLYSVIVLILDLIFSTAVRSARVEEIHSPLQPIYPVGVFVSSMGSTPTSSQLRPPTRFFLKPSFIQLHTVMYTPPHC